MFDMEFNIYALIKPKTKEEYMLVLQEALKVSTELVDQLKDLDRLLSKGD